MPAKLNAYNIFLHIALVALAALTVFLAAENRALKQPPPAAPNGPDIGQEIKDLSWSPLDAPETITEVAATGQESLLFIFTTDCSNCQATQPTWEELHQTIGDSVSIVGLSLSEADLTRSYRDRHSIPFPVGLPTDPSAFMAALTVNGVPLTFRLDASGRVVGSWSGTLSEKHKSEIAATAS
ncbi:MAG: TlpA disulfide reductase family protein [Acidobacteriota bacterium]